jgi:hypothetical protein
MAFGESLHDGRLRVVDERDPSSMGIRIIVLAYRIEVIAGNA